MLEPSAIDIGRFMCPVKCADRAGPVAGRRRPCRACCRGAGRGRSPRTRPTLQVIVDPAGGWFPGPPDDDVGFVGLNEDVAVFGVPGVVECLHQFHVALFGFWDHLALLRSSHNAHRTRIRNRRDSSAVVEVSLFVSASETVVAPALRARKTITTEAPTLASDTWCKTLSVIGRATRQTWPPPRCGTATATTSPRWAAIEATGPVILISTDGELTPELDAELIAVTANNRQGRRPR
jgi:hypothetical protein